MTSPLSSLYLQKVRILWLLWSRWYYPPVRFLIKVDKNVWQAEKCAIRSRKEKKRHNPISKQSTVTRFNFEIKTYFFCSDFASKHWYLFILIIRNIGNIIFPIITWGKEVCLASAVTRTRKQKAKKWQSLIGNILTDIFLFPIVPNKTQFENNCGLFFFTAVQCWPCQ